MTQQTTTTFVESLTEEEFITSLEELVSKGEVTNEDSDAILQAKTYFFTYIKISFQTYDSLIFKEEIHVHPEIDIREIRDTEILNFWRYVILEKVKENNVEYLLTPEMLTALLAVILEVYSNFMRQIFNETFIDNCKIDEFLSLISKSILETFEDENCIV